MFEVEEELEEGLGSVESSWQAFGARPFLLTARKGDGGDEMLEGGVETSDSVSSQLGLRGW